MTMPNYTLEQKAAEFNHNRQCWEYLDGTVASVEITDLDYPTLLDLFWVLSVRERQKKGNEVFPQSNDKAVFPQSNTKYFSLDFLVKRCYNIC